MRAPIQQAPRTSAGKAAPALAALVLALAPAVPLAAPAAAHGGSEQVGVLVEDLTLTPADGRWRATLVLAAFETGDHLDGADAKLAVGAAKPVPLEPAATAGRYEGLLPKSAAGTTTLTLTVRSLPGGALVRAFDATYPGVALSGTSPVGVVRTVQEGGGSSGGLAAGGAVAGGVLALGALVLVLRRHGAARWPVTPAGAG